MSSARKQNITETNLASKKHDNHANKRVVRQQKTSDSSSGAAVPANKSCAAIGKGGRAGVVGVVTHKLHSAASLIELTSPNVVGSATVRDSVVTTPTGGVCGSVATRKCAAITPNKWDAVMNKIAVNKSAGKLRDYSAVKSKVTCGISKRSGGTPAQLQSPLATDQSVVGPPQEQRQQHQVLMTNQVISGKRLFAVNVKR